MTDANTSNASSSPNTHESNDDQTTVLTSVTNNTNDHPVEENGKQSNSITLAEQSQTETKAPLPDPPQRKRRKNIPSSKISRPSVPPSILTNNIKLEKNIPPVPSIPVHSSTSSTTKGNANMIFNLIRSLLEEKKSDNNDENLISTIDCLIDSLQHLREKIKILDNNNNTNTNNNHDTHSSTTDVTHDETSPLNLTKPKKRHQQRLASANSDDMSPSTTTVSSPSPSAPTLPLSSTLFPSQALFYDKPFFPPFSGKSFE